MIDEEENLQNYVSWTAQTLAREAGYRRQLRLSYVGLAGVAVAVVALTVLLFR
jgi:hypothetical protein